MKPLVNTVSSAPTLKSDVIFEAIIERVKADPEKAKSVGGTFLYNITKDKKTVKQWSKYLNCESCDKCVTLFLNFLTEFEI